MFNQTQNNSSSPLLIQIKFYHLFCQRNFPQLKCFYDEIRLCFCQKIKNEEEFLSNCFLFDHKLDFNCSGQNDCLNDGQCFQEQTSCPTISVCQCQLTTNAFSLSLDLILAFHIRPNLNISSQPVPILISLILMIIVTCLGLLNGVLSLIIFNH